MGIMANREQSAEQLFGAVLDLALEDRALSWMNHAAVPLSFDGTSKSCFTTTIA
jgi:hypothetical protein